MKNRPVVSLLVVSTFLLCLALVFVAPNTSFGSQEIITHPALTQNLVAASGDTVLEITEASYQTAQNVLKGGSCRVKNLSGRNITGMGLIWTVTLADGQTRQTQSLMDYSLHKDVTETRGVPPFAPYEEKEIHFIEREPNAADQTIRSVRIEIAFAAFENSGGVGIENSKMYERLLLRREGAEIYKKWLGDIYSDNPKNLNKVLEKLLGDELPADERVKHEGVGNGAAVYRQLMREAYKKNGAASLEQILRRR